ncbi:MAG: hypothetical protein EXR44_07890, partial [Dehalococcoidia bacterium]|nr:hypothetical protein [Dehalococcoidia bacterium]
AVSGDTAVVGAYVDDSYKGSAYMFVIPTDTPTPTPTPILPHTGGPGLDNRALGLLAGLGLLGAGLGLLLMRGSRSARPTT